MAYLVTTAIRNRKLGAFGPGQYYRPGLLHGWYRKKRGQMSSGLGQAPAVYGPPTPEQTPDWLRQALPTDPITAVFVYPPVADTPSLPRATQGSGSPVDQAYRDLITSARPSSDPLDYISPQAAIAAGLDPTKVYAAWSGALRSQVASGKIKSPQDAIAQGWAAGVVTELWPQVSAAVGTVTNWLEQSPLGIANKWLLLGGGGVLLLSGMRGKR